MAVTTTYLSGGRIQGRSDDASGATSTIGTAAVGTNSGSTRVTSPSPPTNLGTYCYEFDGSNDHVTANGTAAAIVGTTGSISFWFNVDVIGNDDWVWKFTNSGDGGGDSKQMGAVFNSSTGQINLQHRATVGGTSNQQNWVIKSATSGITTGGGWYHVVLTQDGTEPELWINGSQTGVTFNEGDSNDKTQWANAEFNEFAIGYSNTTWSNEYDGQFTQMLFYNRKLTNTEIGNLYNSGNGLAAPETDGLLVWYDFQDDPAGTLTNKAITTAKDKSSITNVPAGTRYEETDTRKIFHRRIQTGSEGTDQWVEKGSTIATSALRGCWAGGYASAASNVIDYVVISTLGNAVDFGNLSVTRAEVAGCSNDTRGLWCCGSNSNTDTIDYITIATLGNALDFGNASETKYGVAALADATRACIAGGKASSNTNVIEYFTIASTGNATDFGDLTDAREKPAGNADSTRGLIGGGRNTSARQNYIEYITIQSTGNSTDFGDLTTVREELGSCADATRACWAGGVDASTLSNVIDYVTIQTTGNATDFGNLLSATEICSGCADSTKGLIAGGRVSGSNTTVINYITIQSTGDAADFGDLTEARRGCASGVAA